MMWRKRLIGTLAMALMAGGAFAQDQQEKDPAADRAAREARLAEENARREIEAVQRKLDAEAADLDRAAAGRAQAQKRLEAERALVQDRLKLAERQRQEVLQRQKHIEQEYDRAMEKVQAARPGQVRLWDRFVARQPAMKREKVAFAGVGTSEPPPVLVNQLKLAGRMGLVVDFVEPASPAEQSGIKQYDVLLKFDDQKLVNADQLRSLVRLKKPGDDVKVSLIRQGQPMEIVLELGEKEVEEPVEIGFNDVVLDGNVIRLDAGGDVVAPRVTAAPGGEAIALTNINGRDQAVWTDGKHRLAMELAGGKAVKLKVSEQDGAVEGKPLFESPVETEQQRQAVPPEFREKLKKAESALPKPGVPGAMNAPPPLPVPGMGAGGGVRVWRMDGNAIQFEPGLAPGGGVIALGANPADGGGNVRVVTSTDKDNLMLARIEAGKVIHALVFSQADGKTLFDGPVATPEQRKSLSEAIARQLDVLEKNQNIAPEFGVIGRN